MDAGQQLLVLQAEIRMLVRKRDVLLSEIGRLNRAKASVPTNAGIVREKIALEDEVRRLEKKRLERQKGLEAVSALVLKSRSELAKANIDRLSAQKRLAIVKHSLVGAVKAREALRAGTARFATEQVASVGEQTTKVLSRASSEQRRASRGLELLKAREAVLEIRERNALAKEEESQNRMTEASKIKRDQDLREALIAGNEARVSASLRQAEKKLSDARRVHEAAKQAKEKADRDISRRKALLQQEDRTVRKSLSELKRRESAVLHTQELLENRKKALDDREQAIRDREEMIKRTVRDSA